MEVQLSAQYIKVCSWYLQFSLFPSSAPSPKAPENTNTNPFKELPVAFLLQFFQILLARGTFFPLCIPVVFITDIFRYIFHFLFHTASVLDPKGFQVKCKNSMKMKLPDSVSSIWE